MEQEGEKNLELREIQRKYGNYVADEDSFVIYCETKIDCDDVHVKLFEGYGYDDCYLMDRVGYETFKKEGKKHRACFAYWLDRRRDETRCYFHPCMIIVRIDNTAKGYVSIKLKDEQNLYQFFQEDQTPYQETMLYPIYLPRKSDYSTEAEDDSTLSF